MTNINGSSLGMAMAMAMATKAFFFNSRTRPSCPYYYSLLLVPSFSSFPLSLTNPSPCPSLKQQRHLYSRLYHGTLGVSYGLSSALAARGVIVEDKVFQNLSFFELKQKGAMIPEYVSGIPLHIRGTVVGGGGSEISKAQFNKLLKQVTSHLSSISNLFVHDGAIGSSSESSAKVRVISDSPSAVLSFSKVLWGASARAISHDTCPITAYVMSSISEKIGTTIGLGSQGNRGIIAADTEHSSLILCGKAFADANGVKQSLAALSEPIILARGGIPLAAGLLELGDSVALLFAPEDVLKSSSDWLVSPDAGVILTPEGVAPFFQTRNLNAPSLYNLPAALVLAASDSSGVLPAVSKLSPGQAAYHFLAGYQNGKFLPAFNAGLSCVDALEISKTLLTKLKDTNIVAFLVNVNHRENCITGKQLVKVVEASLRDQENISFLRCKAGGDVKVKTKSFMLSKYGELPKEFSF